MITLTTSYQLIKEGYVGNTGYGNIYLRCYAKYNSQDIVNNKTNISVQTRLYTSTGAWYSTGDSWYAGASGLTTASGATSGSYSAGEVTLGTLTGDIPHNADGTKQIDTSSGFVAGSWGFNTLIGDAVLLPTIPRASKLNSVTNSISDDGNTVWVKPNFTINVNSYYHQLVLQTVGSHETIATFNGVSSGTDYYLDATARTKLYNHIGTSLNNKGVICNLNTYTSSAMTSLVGTSSDLTYFKLPSYTLSTTATITDTISDYDTYKPTSDVLINNLSKPQFTFTTTSSTDTTYGRSIYYKLGNTTISNPYTENNFTGQDFTFIATDDRKTATYTPTLNKVAYFKPTLTSSVSRTTPTGSTIDVTINGTYYDGNGLTNLETPTATITYTETGGTEQSETITLTTTMSDHIVTFSANHTLQNMNYQKDVTWSITISDVLGVTNTNSGSLPQGLPVWNAYRKNDTNYFNVNGNVIANKYNEYELDMNTNNTSDTWIPVLNGNKIQHRVLQAHLLQFMEVADTNGNYGAMGDNSSKNYPIRLKGVYLFINSHIYNRCMILLTIYSSSTIMADVIFKSSNNIPSFSVSGTTLTATISGQCRGYLYDITNQICG